MHHIYRILILPAIIITAGISQNIFPNTSNTVPAKFQKMLDSYKDSPQKYRAARFLLENIDIHKSQSYYWLNGKNQKVPFNEFDYPVYEDAVTAFNRLSLTDKLTPAAYSTPDALLLTSEDLSGNIEAAFAVWQKRWSRSLPFDIFCEYILPYRVMDEPFTEWRKSYPAFFEESFKHCETLKVRDVCTFLSSKHKGWFTDIFDLNLKKELQHALSARQILFRRQGYCEDMANWGVFMLRSLGIASTVDYTPFWATSTGGHFWQVAFDEAGMEIPFFMGDDTPAEFFMRREPSKVLRITYSARRESPAAFLPQKSIPEGFLQLSNYTDVTDKYWKTFSIPVTVNSGFAGDKAVWLSVFNGGAWRIVWWAANTNGKAVFNKMTCGATYLPMAYRNGKEVPAAPPVLLTSDGKTVTLRADMNRRQTLKIVQKQNYLIFRPNAKYSLFYWDSSGKWQLLGTQSPGIAINQFTALTFNNVPANALYILIPQYSQGKERPFTADNSGAINYW